MTDISKQRDIKVALNSMKMVLQSLQKDNLPEQNSTLVNRSHGSLQLMLRKMRVAKLSEVFMQKVSRSNLFVPVTYHHIQSQKEINQNRMFKAKGVSLDPHFISLIYILDIIFCLITFVTGSFRAFIDAFRDSGDQNSGVFIALMIIAIIITGIKILISSITKNIEDGILLEYLFDIWLSFLKNRTVLIDMAYVAINIALLAVHNDSSPLSVALFFISLIKLFSLYENLRTFEITFINSPKKEQYFNLLKVALFNIFFAHFVASMLLAMSLIDKQANWRVTKAIDQQEWYIQYIWAFYWACTVIMTVGFGDFSAFYFREAIIVAFIELFSCIVLAYNISEIGSIILSIRSSQIEFRRKIAIFKRMAKQNQINDQLQRRIQGYLREETKIKETFQFNHQNALLAEIPENLRNQYIIEANRILFPDLPFFKNLQKNTLIRFTQKFTGKVYYPGQYLMKLQQANDSIMILKSGKVGLAYKKYGSQLNGTIVQNVKVVEREVLTNEGVFESKSVPILLNTDFLSQIKKINYDIIAQKYSFVYDITYQNFFEVIKGSQIDSSYFYSIRHKHSVVQNQWEQLLCQYCSTDNKQEEREEQEEDNIPASNESLRQSRAITKLGGTKYHTKFVCPKLHYFPLNGIAILKSIRHQGEQQQSDKGYFRKRPRQLTSLMLRKQFFQMYEESRNFGTKKIVHIQKQEKKSMSLRLLQKVGVDRKSQVDIKVEQDKLQHFQTIERIVRESIEEALTGYKPQFWQLQLDMLHNYTNYFPIDNSKNLDFVQLGKGRQHIHDNVANGVARGMGRHKSIWSLLQKANSKKKISQEG